MDHKFPQPNIKKDTNGDIYKEYKDILEALKHLEKVAVYSESEQPKLPENCIKQETKEKWMFIGFSSQKQGESRKREEGGVAEFCFGKKYNGSEYKYMTQTYFDIMIKKVKLALDALEKANLH